MDKKRSVLNVSTSVISRVILLAAALLVRRLLIRNIGNDVNGLNSLYSGIIGMLTVAELGVGSAIVYSMYRPIIDGNEGKVAALYRLYQKLYRIIGAVIFGAGLLVAPFLPALISDYKDISVNVYLPYILTLVSVVLSYLYSAKTSLIEAHKDNYITTAIMALGRLTRFALQIAAILIWKSYVAYVICQIIETLLIGGLTELVVRKRHGRLLAMRESVDPETKSEIKRNVKAMFMHKIGTILVNSIDSMIISGFIGVVVLGKYSNYAVLAGVLSGTISLFFSPLTSIVGHLCATGDPEKTERSFHHFFCLNYILGVVAYLGYFAVADHLVALVFGREQIVSRSIVFIISLNQFTQSMRVSSLLFRDASGTFYYDRWKPVAEGLINLALSLLFVMIFPPELRTVGVIVATIITTLLICNIVEPYVVFHHVFQKSPRRFYIKSYSYIFLFSVCLYLMTWIRQPGEYSVVGLLTSGLLSVCISILFLGALYVLDRSFRHELRTMVAAAPDWLRQLKSRG